MLLVKRVYAERFSLQMGATSHFLNHVLWFWYIFWTCDAEEIISFTNFSFYLVTADTSQIPLAAAFPGNLQFFIISIYNKRLAFTVNVLYIDSWQVCIT